MILCTVDWDPLSQLASPPYKKNPTKSPQANLFLFFGFSRQSFSIALDPVLELALLDQAGLELTEIRMHMPPPPGKAHLI